jgi:amino acid transporter
MKIEIWNKMPMWARFLAILFGIPTIAALLRITFEHWFSGLTGKILALLVLMIASALLLLHRRRKHPHVSIPMSSEEKQHENREVTKLMGLIFAIMALIFLAGTIIGFYGASTPGSFSLVRAAMGIIGLMALVLAFVCFEQSKYEFLQLTRHRRQPSASDIVSVSNKTVLWTLMIIAAIVFAIARLRGH